MLTMTIVIPEMEWFIDAQQIIFDFFPLWNETWPDEVGDASRSNVREQSEHYENDDDCLHDADA